MGSLPVGRCAVGLHDVLRRRIGSASYAHRARAVSVHAGCSRGCHLSASSPTQAGHGDTGGNRGVANLSAEPAVPAAVSQHMERLAHTAARIARLGEKGLLTNEEAGRLGDQLADCLKLHRQYNAAIEGHAAVVVADCVHTFTSDEQLANVLSTLPLTSSSSQTAPAEVSDPALPSAFAADSIGAQSHGCDLLRNIEQRMLIEDIRKVESGNQTDINDIPPWPWDPLPAAESQGSAARVGPLNTNDGPMDGRRH